MCHLGLAPSIAIVVHSARTRVIMPSSYTSGAGAAAAAAAAKGRRPWASRGEEGVHLLGLQAAARAARRSRARIPG